MKGKVYTGLMFVVLLLLCLFGCSGQTAEPEVTPTPTPVPTPNPYLAYSGQWTMEIGDGSLIWNLRDDGTVLISETAVDDYRTMGGLGTWQITEQGAVMVLDREVELIAVEEDGFTKLYCPRINRTLVRPHEREAAYAAKFVDVQLTDANVWEYFSFRQVPSPVDEKGERIWKQVFVMCSPMYDKGLIYWSEQDVELDFVYWTSYQLQADKAPYGVNFLVNSFNSVKAKGTLTFVRADHVASYACSGDSRTVILNDGVCSETVFTDHRYDGYPY